MNPKYNPIHALTWLLCCIPSGACSLSCFVKGSQHHIGNTANSVLLVSPSKQECLDGWLSWPYQLKCNNAAIHSNPEGMPAWPSKHLCRGFEMFQLLRCCNVVGVTAVGKWSSATITYEEGRTIITTSTETLGVAKDSHCAWFLTFIRPPSGFRQGVGAARAFW